MSPLELSTETRDWRAVVRTVALVLVLSPLLCAQEVVQPDPDGKGSFLAGELPDASNIPEAWLKHLAAGKYNRPEDVYGNLDAGAAAGMFVTDNATQLLGSSKVWTPFGAQAGYGNYVYPMPLAFGMSAPTEFALSYPAAYVDDSLYYATQANPQYTYTVFPKAGEVQVGDTYTLTAKLGDTTATVRYAATEANAANVVIGLFAEWEKSAEAMQMGKPSKATLQAIPGLLPSDDGGLFRVTWLERGVPANGDGVSLAVTRKGAPNTDSFAFAGPSGPTPVSLQGRFTNDVSVSILDREWAPGVSAERAAFQIGDDGLTQLDGWSDWAATFVLEGGAFSGDSPMAGTNVGLRGTFATGSPVLHLNVDAQNLLFTLQSTMVEPAFFYPSVEGGEGEFDPSSNVQGFFTRALLPTKGPDPAPYSPVWVRSAYAIVTPPGTTWKQSGALLSCRLPEATGNEVTVVLLPSSFRDGRVTFGETPPPAPSVSDVEGLAETLHTLLPYAFGEPRQQTGAGKDTGTGTQVSWSYDAAASTVTTSYDFNCTPRDAGEVEAKDGTIYALFSHQWHNPHTATLVPTVKSPFTYETCLGPMQVAVGTGFESTMKFPGVLPALPNAAGLKGADTFARGLWGDESTTLANMLTADATQYRHDSWPPKLPIGVDPDYDPRDPSSFGGTYFTGKFVQAYAELFHLAGELDVPAAQSGLYDRLLGPDLGLGEGHSGTFTQWFTASKDDGGYFFYYDDVWGSFIGYPGSFNADTALTDHHFHYGYWIGAAARIAQARPEFVAEYGAMVDLLVKDIANAQREQRRPFNASTSTFPTPFLRNFDPYAGHGWALGMPRGPLNQESSSEALNAWAAIMLWGQVSASVRNPENPDFAMRDLGIWLYTQELQAARSYWFDGFDELPREFKMQGAVNTAQHPLNFATVVDASGRRQATNFGYQPVFYSGILMLPFTGSSLYLSSPAFHGATQGMLDWTVSSTAMARRNNDTGNWPTDFPPGWAEYVFQAQAMLSEDGHAEAMEAWGEALGQGSQTKGSTPAEGAYFPDSPGTTVSYVNWWLHQVGALGRPDRDLRADYPFAMAFTKGETTHYVAWNLGGMPADGVTFWRDDEKALTLKPEMGKYLLRTE